MKTLSMDRMEVRLEALKLAVIHITEYNTQNPGIGTKEVLIMAGRFEKYIEEGNPS